MSRAKRWFMSYAYSLKGMPGEVHFGSCITDDGEHPVKKISRWNNDPSFDYRRHVLLNFFQVDADTPEMSWEC